MKKIKFLILWLVLSIIWLSSFSSAYEVFLVDYPWILNNWGVLTLTWDAYVIPHDFYCESSNSCNLVLKNWNEVYLNSLYVPWQQPLINIFNQGFLFSSGSYTILNPQYAGIDEGFSSYSVQIIPVEACPTCEDCSSCQSSLGACLEDNVSLENMNQSLSEELTSCLESWGSWCNPEVDTGCVEGAIVPLLSWSVWLDSFTTPIINNLTLPTNYKWRIEDWVLTIASINSNLSIDDSDYWNIKSVFISVVLYTFGLGLMLILVYYIKFYFFNIKDK